MTKKDFVTDSIVLLGEKLSIHFLYFINTLVGYLKLIGFPCTHGVQPVWTSSFRSNSLSVGVLPEYLNDPGDEQRWIKNTIKDLRWSSSQRYLTKETINYFGKKLHLRHLTGLWLRLWAGGSLFRISGSRYDMKLKLAPKMILEKW